LTNANIANNFISINTSIINYTLLLKFGGSKIKYFYSVNMHSIGQRRLQRRFQFQINAVDLLWRSMGSSSKAWSG